MGDVEQADKHGKHGIDDFQSLCFPEHTEYATDWNKVRERHHEHDHTLVNVAVGGYNGHVLAPEHEKDITNGVCRKPADGQQPQNRNLNTLCHS